MLVRKNKNVVLKNVSCFPQFWTIHEKNYDMVPAVSPPFRSFIFLSLLNILAFRTVLKRNNLTQKLIRPHTPEQNGIVERANKTMRESLAPVMLTDYEQAKSEISRIIEYYNNNR